MPPERHSSPPPRPPRDRHTGPGFSGPRRSFGGGGFGGGAGREGGGPRPPFPPRSAPPAEPPQSVRLREGDREVEVHGNPAFIRQTLDDLPTLFARLRGEPAPPSRPASISLPRPPRAAAVEEEPVDELDEDLDEDEEEPEPPAPARRERQPAKPAGKAARRDRHPREASAEKRGRSAANGRGSLEDRIFSALERADHPLSVAAIRKQIGGDTTGQQVRRILERASDRVVATSERPAAYALR